MPSQTAARIAAALPRDAYGRLTLAYVLLGLAVLGNNGAFFPPLLPLVLGSLALLVQVVGAGAAAGVLPEAPAGGQRELWDRRLCRLLGFQWVISLVRLPGASPRPIGWLLAYLVLTSLILVGVLAGATRSRWRRPALFAGLLFLYLCAGYAVLRICPQPRIDVFVIQQGGAHDLLAGHNPYRSVFPNIYDDTESQKFFGHAAPALSNYPYPPLSLLVSTLSYALSGDIRMLWLLLQAGTALLLYRVARRHLPEPRALLILGLYLLHPRGLYVLEQAWTEPLLFGALALLLWLLDRPHPKVLQVGSALSLFLAAKQYAVLLLPLFFLRPRSRASAWHERNSGRLVLFGAVGAAFFTLPLLLWDVPAFVEDVLLFQLRQPFRPDALSIPAAFYLLSGWQAPGVLALLGAATALLWSRYRLPRSLHGLCLGAALVYMSFFLMAKQAFCNYYYFAGVLYLFAAATVDVNSVDGPAQRIQEIA